MKRGYIVTKLSELAKELNLPSSKGYSAAEYLEFVIEQVELKGLLFVQFFQLVDVLYIIVKKKEAVASRPEDNRGHEKTLTSEAPRGKTDISIEKSDKPEIQNSDTELFKHQETLKKSMDKPSLPWQK